MKYKIQQISPHQSSMVLALMAAIIALPFAFFGLLGVIFSFDSFNGSFLLSVLLFIFTPIFYGMIGYVFNRLFCLVYNMIAKRIGGIELTLQSSEQQTPSK